MWTREYVDQQEIIQALATLRRLLSEFPDGDWAAQAERLVAELQPSSEIDAPIFGPLARHGRTGHDSRLCDRSDP